MSNSSELFIGLIGGAFGTGIISLIAIALKNYFDSRKYEKELKTFLWKEKIEASKKASEFYLEFLNYLNLLILNYELISDKEIGVSGLQERIDFYETKLKSFDSHGHHHINIFYDLFSKKAQEITTEINKILHKIELFGLCEPTKTEDIKELFNELKIKYSSLTDIYDQKINIIRTNINQYLQS